MPWWQTWYAVVPGLLLCAPFGLVGLWCRRDIATRLKGLLTCGVALLLVFSSVGSAHDRSRSRPIGATGISAAPATTTPAIPVPQGTPLPTNSTQGTPTPVAAPRLAGLQLAAAQAELSRQGLVVGQITRQPSRQPADTVLTQAVNEGTAVAPGSAVDLVVAGPLPQVPGVVGKNESEAAAAIRAAGLTVAVTTQQATSGVNGSVVRTMPAAGTPLDLGGTVQLVVLEVVPPKPPIEANCTPGYDPCLPPASDYDCAGGKGNGPKFVRGPVRVTGNDIYDLDRDHDGIGCENGGG